ncbi:MAG: transposase, partial [Tannerella sp.]|nr:transposase [Tannerella sp.]
MHIANPIYDTVFKFMMEDERVARAFISAIIGEEVVELKFTPQERTVRVDPQKKQAAEKDTEQGKCLTVFRIDFSSHISTPDGRGKTVMIELQKAKFVSDVMRFRRYLGQRYQDAGSTYGSEDGENALTDRVSFMWLSGGRTPDHNTINRFRSSRLKDSIRDIFTQAVRLLVEMGHLSLETVYVDGTKIESRANRYTFVWRKSVEKHKAKSEEKIRRILEQIEECKTGCFSCVFSLFFARFAGNIENSTLRIGKTGSAPHENINEIA